MNTQTISKVLAWVVKVAGVIVCAPVTWLVAGELFTDIESAALRYVVQLAAVLLVEGVLLSNWLLMDYDHDAAPEIKARYAATALLMYVGLWVLAWQHGEGAAGLVFRAALGAAIVGSGWDTYAVTWQRLTARADENALTDGSVRKHRRKAAIADAKAAIDAEFQLSAEQRSVDTEVQLETLKRVREQRMTSVKREHTEAMRAASNSEGFPYPVAKARSNALVVRQTGKAKAKAKMIDIYRTNPHASLREVGDAVGRNHQTVSDYLKELEADGKIHKNGNGVEVIN